MNQLKSFFSMDQIQRKSAVRHFAISTARTYAVLLWKGDVQKILGIFPCMQDYIA